MNTKRIASLSLATLIVAVLPARAEEPKTIIEVIGGSKEHKIFLKSLVDTRLTDLLKSKGEWTVFAPTDLALKKLDKTTVKEINRDEDELKKFLQAHVVKGKLSSAALIELNGKEIETLQGTKFKVTVEGKNVFVGGAKLTMLDVKASNGVVHVIDAALMPPK